MQPCFVFVCQGGSIEPKAALLAASLSTFVQCDAEIIAAIPSYPEVLPPTTEAIEFLHKLGVRVEEIVNEVDPTYPIANKIACFNIPTDADKFVFLDSDILCLQEIHEDQDFGGCEFAARLTDFSDLRPVDWCHVYEHCDKEPPEFDHRSIVSNEHMPLCFNSGVVITTQPGRLHHTWTAFARKLNHRERFPFTRPFLDQISLPFAVRELGLTIHLLDQYQHCPSAIFPIDLHHPAVFAHYHGTIHLLGDKLLANIAQRLIREHAGLDRLLQPGPFLSLLC